MNSKKGFTLIELLAVIAIIGLIAGLVLTKIMDLRNNFNDAGQNLANEVIINAAKQYVRGNKDIKSVVKGGATRSITFKTLVEKGYLTSNSTALRDIKTGQNIDLDAHYVCIKYETNKYVYKIDTCE